jgi:catechol 2,3-dioxygenase
MPVLPHNPDPAFNLTRLSHVVLTSRDLDATRAFYETGLGLEVTGQDAERLYLRALEETSHHSLVFEKADAAPGVCRAVGCRVAQEADLDRAADHLAGLGRAADFVERPFQGRTLRFRDPAGVCVELCATMEQRDSRMQQFHLHRGGRLAFMDHVQINTHDVDATYAFYADLGFRLTEYTTGDGNDEMIAVWLKRKNNTQDLVYSRGPGPRLHHFAYHTPEIANVVHAADVMGALGLGQTMDRPLGRHGIGNAFFCYFRDPDGHRIEIFTSHYTVIDANQAPRRWEIGDTRRSQLWGFPAPRKWFAEATHFDGVDLTQPPPGPGPMTLEEYLARWS